MAWFGNRSGRDGDRADGQRNARAPILEIAGLDVHYGQAHALQGIDLAFDHGVLAVVGRNGMGKTTLCNAITGLVPARGSVRLGGREILGLAPNRITMLGIGYVPQGRRVWPSLSVDEHLRLAGGTNKGPWTIERVYRTFPRLAERKSNGGSQLSGGEQQMLAISRALLFNPALLVMDEPTEGLAPVIVEQVGAMLKALAAEGDISVLLVEQNLGVAIDVADQVAVMVNGRIARRLPAAELAADLDLQHRLLGVRGGAHDDDDEDDADETGAAGSLAADPHGALDADDAGTVRIFTVRRAHDASGEPASAEGGPADERAVRGFTRWNSGDTARPAPLDRPLGPLARPAPGPRDALFAPHAASAGATPSIDDAARALSQHNGQGRVMTFPVGASVARAAYVAGTFDTKARELFFLRNCIEKLGLRTVTVDLSTSGKPSPAMVHPREVARHHPDGERAVLTGDRGSAVSAMATAFEHYVATRRDIGGLISAGGSGGTALATAGMRRLPVGVPKLMVSTVASGDVRPYVGPADICMMYSVTDVAGINRISEQVLSNAAHALAGMIAHAPRPEARTADAGAKPAIGLTMFGVTTTCVQAVVKMLEDRFDCLVFHATGTGGQSMEKLAESKLLDAVLDLTTTEICDEIAGGVLSAGPDRLGVFGRGRVPWVGSCGALDMVNFWAFDTVPARYRQRNLYRHNPNVTLMRTTADECRRIGEYIAAALNRMQGPVRFLIPEGGVSALDAPGQPFHDPVADKVLFDTIAGAFRAAPNRRLVRVPHHINAPAFADAAVASLAEVLGEASTLRASA